MIDFVKKNIFKFLIGVPIVLQIFGSLINNIYMTKLNIIDTNPFKTFQIFTGTIFLAISLIYFLIFAINTDLKEPYKNKFFMIKTLFRVMLLTNNTFFYLASSEIFPITMFNIEIPSNIELMFLLFSLFYLGFKAFIGIRIKKSDFPKWEYIIYRICEYIMIVLTIIGFLLLYFENKSFMNIANYIFACGLSFYFAQIGRAEIQLKKKNPEYKPTFHFSSTGTFSLIEIIFPVICLFFSFSGLVSLYANSIYTFLPTNLGGVKKINMEVKTDDSNYNGYLMYQNDKYFYIEKDDVIFQVLRDDVESFKTVE